MNEIRLTWLHEICNNSGTGLQTLVGGLNLVLKSSLLPRHLR